MREMTKYRSLGKWQPNVHVNTKRSRRLKMASGFVLGTNDFTENKVLFFKGSFRLFFFFYLLFPRFFSFFFLFYSHPFHRHYVKQNINQVS